MDEAGFATAHVAGNSLGGYVALMLVARWRAKSIVIPPELLAQQMLGAAACNAVRPLVEHARTVGYRVEPEPVTCPVRIVWGTRDELLPWPSAAVRFRTEWFPHADWVVLDDVGHAPQLDVPLQAAQLILGVTGG